MRIYDVNFLWRKMHTLIVCIYIVFVRWLGIVETRGMLKKGYSRDRRRIAVAYPCMVHKVDRIFQVFRYP